MSILKIRTYPDPVLKETCAPVETIDERIRTLLQDMAETMYASSGVGLAAPQVGENLRMIVVDIQNRGEGGGRLLKLINPEITQNEGQRKSEEGCLSLPELILDVDRFEKVTVEALDPDGREQRIEAEGLLSIAVQHEIDHLNGVLYIDKLTAPDRLWTEEEFQAQSADEEGEEPETIPLA